MALAARRRVMSELMCTSSLSHVPLRPAPSRPVLHRSVPSRLIPSRLVVGTHGYAMAQRWLQDAPKATPYRILSHRIFTVTK